MLILAFMALLRIKNPEQIEKSNVGDLGIVLGFDRCPCGGLTFPPYPQVDTSVDSLFDPNIVTLSAYWNLKPWIKFKSDESSIIIENTRKFNLLGIIKRTLSEA